VQAATVAEDEPSLGRLDQLSQRRDAVAQRHQPPAYGSGGAGKPERTLAWAGLGNGRVAGEDQVDAGCVIDGEILLCGRVRAFRSTSAQPAGTFISNGSTERA
jgi:hypothetical protein